MQFPQSAHWQPKLNGPGYAEGLDDLRQCIETILLTPVGSDPLRPEFGSRIGDYVDWPVDRARPHVVRETVEAVRRWEKRVTLTRTEVLVDEAGLVVRPYWKTATGVEVSAEVRP